MLEGSAENLTNQFVIKAIRKGLSETQKIINGIKKLCSKCGKEKRPLTEEPPVNPEMVEAIKRWDDDELAQDCSISIGIAHVLVIDGWGISCEIALRLLSLNLADDISNISLVYGLVPTSCYLSQC